jgi:cation diffusion facilitator CzcD-associated flavoprotein CzcO
VARSVSVVIVGAGFGGVAAAVALKEQGVDDIAILERGDRVGGVWRANTYPGLACDVPSHLYSFSFAPNPRWSRRYSPREDIQRYVEDVARRYDVMRHVRLGEEVTRASFDDDAGRWRVETAAGETFEADVLITACGQLQRASVPAIAGLDRFRGAMFHSAHWDHDVELDGKRVAVIGTGASAIQIVPELAGTAARVDVYQRTAPWVLPRRDVAYRPWQKMLLRRFPPVQRLARAAVYLAREATVPMFVAVPGLGKLAARSAIRNIDKAISDPVLRAKVLPHFALGCKRVLISNDWYPALTRPNVDLITEPIRRLTETGIVAGDGAEREIDVLVVATGFLPTELPIAQLIKGTHGQTLSDAWSEHGIQAYKGATVAGFPNLFFVVGPNTGLGHSSMVYMIESQLAYLIDAWRTMRRHQLATVEVLPEAQREWNRDLQRRMRRTVWHTGGCRSWYLDAHGRNVTLWPRTTYTFRRLTKRFDLPAYRSTALADRPAAAPASA